MRHFSLILKDPLNCEAFSWVEASEGQFMQFFGQCLKICPVSHVSDGQDLLCDYRTSGFGHCVRFLHASHAICYSIFVRVFWEKEHNGIVGSWPTPNIANLTLAHIALSLNDWSIPQKTLNSRSLGSGLITLAFAGHQRRSARVFSAHSI